MSAFDDDQDMTVHDDELLLTGQPVQSEPELAAFVAALRITAVEPAPHPSLALAALLRDGLPPQSATPGPARALAARHDRPVLRNPLRTVAGLGLAAKILLGAGIAAATVTGAATIDGVPGTIQRPASAIVVGVVDLFRSGAAAPVKHAPARHAPLPDGSDDHRTGTGATGTATDPGATTAGSLAPVVVPSPAVPLPVPVDPGAVVPAVPNLHDLLQVPDGSEHAPVLPAVPPLVVPLVPGQQRADLTL